MNLHFFSTAEAWRRWLEKNHAIKTELLVGFFKLGSGHPSVTWPESVDEALCFGWIDGVRRRIDELSYSIRFSVRKPGSIWSNVNIGKAKSLVESGKMTAAGLAKFEGRKAEKSGIYAYEQKALVFDAESRKKFMTNPAAWTFFQAQPASYRSKVIWRVMCVKLPLTREKRLAALIEASALRKRL